MDRVTVAEAAVDWQRLDAQHRELVTVVDGIPFLAGVPELQQRAEALIDAARRGRITGVVVNEDGYPLRAESVRLDRGERPVRPH
ncbi:MAG: hypothetical protein MZW92_65965 [Comamonadaceae bacterium]|nr:hypothetical protein [Comamonadaceae bacterium]